MAFIDTIVERDNKALLALEECKKNCFPTYILGDGEGADNTERRASQFSFSGRLVNRKYFLPKKGVYCLEDVLDETDKKVNLIVAYKGFKKSSLEKWKDKIEILIDLDFYAGNYSVDPELFTFSFVKENEKVLESVYDQLEDNYSRKVFSAYINQKISSDYKYLQDVKTSAQYFDKDIIHFTNQEVFVDCGAYDGDSALSFVDTLKSRGISTYKKIISFEPDPYNYDKLLKRNIENHICINKGTSDKQAELSFSILGTSSGVIEKGEIEIKVDSLDNMIDDDVTFIKMDIEGAELEALKGARKLIEKCCPTLAICIYHKKEDLWVIQNYIKCINSEYRFFIRAYEDTATELVLYAVI